MQLEIIAWVGFSQALFAALLMITKPDQKVPDKILSAWLFLLSIEFLSCAIDHTIFGKSMLPNTFLLLNPALFLYINSLTSPKFRLKILHLLHLIPYLFFEISAYFINEPFSVKAFFEPTSTQIFKYSFSIASFVSWIVYNSLSGMLVMKHREKIKDEFSTIERNKRLNWILFIFVFYNLLCIVLMGVNIMVIIQNKLFHIPLIYNYSVLLVIIYIISFYGLRQKLIYQTIYKENHIDESLKNNNGKYKRSVLNHEKKEKIKEVLVNYFDHEQPYLNPELSMQLVAEKLSIPKHQLTEVLNTSIGKNFFQFVNEYRIEAVKKMLLDPKTHYSIEAIGYECGFNNKSTFFSVFKSFTGFTPLQYRNKFK